VEGIFTFLLFILFLMVQRWY